VGSAQEVASREAVVAEIRRRLNTIGDPCSVANGVAMGLDEMGLVEDITLDPAGNAVVRLRLTSPTCLMVGYFKAKAEERVSEVPGVSSVEVLSDRGLDWSPTMMSDAAKERRRAALLARGINTEL
jgi:metal-sulfur cluster biosynthetic enzyme